jgi:hypothetical protein
MTTLLQAREAVAATLRQSDRRLSCYPHQMSQPQIPAAMIDVDKGPDYDDLGQHMTCVTFRVWLLESLAADWEDGQRRLDERCDLVGPRSIPAALMAADAAWRGVLDDVQFLGFARIPAVDTPGPVFVDWVNSAYWGCALQVFVRYGIS